MEDLAAWSPTPLAPIQPTFQQEGCIGLWNKVMMGVWGSCSVSECAASHSEKFCSQLSLLTSSHSVTSSLRENPPTALASHQPTLTPTLSLSQNLVHIGQVGELCLGCSAGSVGGLALLGGQQAWSWRCCLPDGPSPPAHAQGHCSGDAGPHPHPQLALTWPA